MANFKISVQQIRGRGVFRAGVAYAAAYLIVQIASVLLPVFNVQYWILRALIITLLLVFPGVLVFSYFFDITADGVVRAEDKTQEIAADPLFR